MKKYPGVIIFLILTVFSVKAQDINEKWLEAINQGKKLYKAGNFDSALKRFQTASYIVTFDTTAFVYMADCGLKSGNPEAVNQAVEKLMLLQYKTAFLFQIQAATLRSIEKNTRKLLIKYRKVCSCSLAIRDCYTKRYWYIMKPEIMPKL